MSADGGQSSNVVEQAILLICRRQLDFKPPYGRTKLVKPFAELNWCGMNPIALSEVELFYRLFEVAEKSVSPLRREVALAILGNQLLILAGHGHTATSPRQAGTGQTSRR